MPMELYSVMCGRILPVSMCGVRWQQILPVDRMAIP